MLNTPNVRCTAIVAQSSSNLPNAALGHQYIRRRQKPGVLSFLDRRQPVLEGIHIAWRAASTFDSTFAWNACHKNPELSQDDFRLFYQNHVRLFTGQTFAHLSARAKKREIDRALTLEHYTPNKAFVSREGSLPFWIRKVREDLPIYIFSGSDDPVGEKLKGVRVLIERYRGAGIASITHDFYPGGRHEMLHELNRREVFTNLLGWICALVHG